MEKQEDYSDCDREEYLGRNISHRVHHFSFITLESILEDLTPYDVRQLVMMEDEMAEIKASIFLTLKSSPFSLSYHGLNYVFNEV